MLYLTGLVGAGVYLFYLLHWFAAICFAVFLTFLYSAPKLRHPLFKRLREIAVGKTLFLTFVWVYVTAVLPIIVAGAPWSPSFLLFSASRFFLIYSICIVFDYRDREDDKLQGIRSMITALDEKGIDRLFWISLILFVSGTIALSGYHYPAFYIFLLLVPGLILAGIYRQAKRNFSDYLYYIVLDGLMVFSGLLMLIFRI